MTEKTGDRLSKTGRWQQCWHASGMSPRYAGICLAACAVWWLAYAAVGPLSEWIAYGALGLDREGAPGQALAFFLYDTAKIFLLLALMIYGIAWLRAGLNTDRVRVFLSGRGRGAGYALGALFGAVTPFCSCSSIPLFLGFTSAGIPLGATMAFLITSPLINEVAVVVLWGVLGWRLTLVYVVVGLVAGMLGGVVLDALHAERWLMPLAQGGTRPGLLDIQARHVPRMGVEARHAFARAETAGIFGKVWRWVIAGVGLGALLHGFVPQAWFGSLMNASQWWSVPAAVAAGIPLYTNVTGIIPVLESLLLKGLPAGTALAFCMSTVGASLPEMIMLRQVMRWQLMALFLGLLLVFFTCAGWIINACI